MRTDPWMSAHIIRGEQLTSSCQIIRIRPRGVLTNLVAGQTVNISIRPPLEKRRVSSFTVLSTHTGGDFSLLIRSTGTGGVSDGLMSITGISETIWVGDSVPTMTLPSRVNGETILCLVAGSGVSILGGLAKNHALEGTDVVFVGREEDSTVIPKALIKYLDDEIPKSVPRRWTTWNSTVRGRPTQTDIKRMLGSRDRYTAVVACGPGGFCQLVQETCVIVGIDQGRLAIEPFDVAAAFTKGAPVSTSTVTAVVDLFGQTHAINWPENEDLLSAMLNAGLEAPYSCRLGICSTCQCSVVMGDSEMETDLGLSEEEKASGLALACQLRPVSRALAVRFTTVPNA